MGKISIENLYQLYLKRIGLSDSTMHEAQKTQLRHAYFDAFGQFILLLETDIANMDEDTAVEALEGIKRQAANYFLSINQN